MAVGAAYNGQAGYILVSEAPHGSLSLQPDVFICFLLHSSCFGAGLRSARGHWFLQVSCFVSACLLACLCRSSLGEYQQTANSLPPGAYSLFLPVVPRVVDGHSDHRLLSSVQSTKSSSALSTSPTLPADIGPIALQQMPSFERHRLSPFARHRIRLPVLESDGSVHE